VAPGRIYAIIDREAALGAGHEPLDAVRAACDAGVTLFQLRDKGATGAALYGFGEQLMRVVEPYDARLLVNGRADIARALGAAGVHRPGDGMSVAALRAVLGEGLVFGSAHSQAEALALQAAGADAVVLSPIFLTASKPGYGPALGLTYLRAACAKLHIPVYALGGVTPQEVVGCMESGAYGVAVLGGIFAHAAPGEQARAYVYEARTALGGERVG
jgi:thiamine-phosphate pyrophosphorylase